jgi:DNA-binding MarR family transcriptional regulator
MTRWLSEAEQRAWRGLLQMTTKLEAQLNRELQEAGGLSLADYDVLVPLSEAPQGRLRVFELASDLGWERSRLSHHLGRMQRRGLVTREDCAADGRGSFIVLTDDGLRAIEAAAPGHVASVRKHFIDLLTHEQVEMLGAVTSTVVDRLAISGDDPPRHPR